MNGRIPYINNNSNFITGMAGNTQDASEIDELINKWNTQNGVKASTTHNVYGIYDLSGGAFEYVAAFYIGGDSKYLEDDVNEKIYAGELYINKDTKYVEVYENSNGSSKNGDAIYETSLLHGGESGWDGDSSHMVDFSRPIIKRGGYYIDVGTTGIFDYSRDKGMNGVSRGFRAVLSIK